MIAYSLPLWLCTILQQDITAPLALLFHRLEKRSGILNLGVAGTAVYYASKYAEEQIKLSRYQMRLATSQASINAFQFYIGIETQMMLTTGIRANEYTAAKDFQSAKDFIEIMNHSTENVEQMKEKLNKEIKNYNDIAKDI